MRESVREGIRGFDLMLRIRTDSMFVPEGHRLSEISLSVLFADSLKRPLAPLDSTTQYREKFYAGFRFSEPYAPEKIFSCFVPYYVLDLPAGKRKIFLKVAAISIKAEYKNKKGELEKESIPVFIRGERWKFFEFEKPETRKFRVCIGILEFLPYDAKGSPWDYGFFSGDKEKPDISVGIKTYEYRYFFPEAHNRFYTDYSGHCSPWIIVGADDEISVQALDLDSLSPPDIAGSKRFRSEATRELTFPLRLEDVGQVRIWEIVRAEFK